MTHQKKEVVESNKLRETQLLQVELLKKIRQICMEEGLNYYLAGGTAIGAVRHQGFIPWDDDIDVILLRDDYDRFLSIADKYLDDGQKILHYTLDDIYADYTMKLVDTRVSFTIKTAQGELEQNIWIDIFPVDGTPKINVLRGIHYRKIYFLRMLLAYHFIDRIQFNENRVLWKRVLIGLAKWIPVYKLINPHFVMRKMDSLLLKYPVSKSKIVCSYSSAYFAKEFVAKSCFADGVNLLFEGEEYPVPQKYDKYLKHIFGDYMKLPPKEKRVPKHSVIEIHYKK